MVKSRFPPRPKQPASVAGYFTVFPEACQPPWARCGGLAHADFRAARKIDFERYNREYTELWAGNHLFYRQPLTDRKRCENLEEIAAATRELETNPGNSKARLRRIRAHFALGQLDAVLKECEYALDRYPDPWAMFFMGCALALQGEYPGGKHYLRKYLERMPDEDVGLWTMAEILEKAGDEKGAAAYYKSFAQYYSPLLEFNVPYAVEKIVPADSKQAWATNLKHGSSPGKSNSSRTAGDLAARAGV